MQESQSNVGPIVGSVIVIIILIIGGLYFYGERLANAPSPAQTTTETGTDGTGATVNDSDPVVTKMKEQSTSDEVSDIQADLNATDVGSATADFNSDATLSN